MEGKRCMKFYHKLQHVKPQQTAIAGGNFLMFNYGIHFGYSFFHWKDVAVAWTDKITDSFVALVVVMFFIGNIVGFSIAPASLKLFSKKSIYLIANGLVLVSSLLFIVVPQFSYTVFFGRFIVGVAGSCGYVALIQHYGEIAIDNQRGRIGTAVHLFILKGGIVSGSAVISFFAVEGRMDINRFLGICCLGFSLLAILLTTIFYKESPLTLIKNGKETEAKQTMLLLRGEAEVTPEIAETLDEFRAMVAEEKHLDTGIFGEGNLKPLLIVLRLKLAFVLTFNYAMKYIHLNITKNAKINYNFILNLVHTFTVVFVLFTIDKGRRIHFIISGFGTSLILIVFGALRATVFAHSNFLVFIMFVAFEFFSALGIGLLTVTYSTEAFSTPKKAGSIAFTGILESCLQILFVIWAENVVYSNVFDVVLLLFSGFVLGLFSVFLFRKLPETSNISLRSAQNKFKL